MYKVFIKILGFLLAFTIIISAGYQCATEKAVSPATGIPIQNLDSTFIVPKNNLYPQGYVNKQDNSSSSRHPRIRKDNYNSSREQDNGSCPRKTYDKLSKDYGAMALFKIYKSDFEDYRLGETLNLPLNCARIYLDMQSRHSSLRSGANPDKRFSGHLVIAYDDGKKLYIQKYKTGSSQEDIQYNDWEKSAFGTGNRRGQLNLSIAKNSNFFSFFEDQDTAIIFKITNVDSRYQRDSKTTYQADGEIHYKMFRTYANKRDNCYFNGNYVRSSKLNLPRKKKCWLLSTGPFSCLPDGIETSITNDHRYSDQYGYTCYKRLGIFSNLNLEEAFNVY